METLILIINFSNFNWIIEKNLWKKRIFPPYLVNV